MSALFIAGAGTDVGKTFVTAGLLGHLRAVGVAAKALKPVASGFDPRAPEASDPGVLLAAMGRAIDAQNLDAIAPFRFAAPLAPDMAARREGKTIALAPVADFCRAQITAAQAPLLIEGVGGVMSPIADDATCLDLAGALECPVLLVAGSYLGAISHALTATLAIHARGLDLAAIVVSESADSVGLADTAAAIARFAPEERVHQLPRSGVDEHVWSALARDCRLLPPS